MILVPFDYTEYSLDVLPLAFSWAEALGTDIVLLHTYDEEQRHRWSIIERIIDPEAHREEQREMARLTLEKEKAKAEKLRLNIEQRIERGEIKRVPFAIELEEGVAEDEIVKYAEAHSPQLICMTTRATARKEADMVGSVTAEVVESSSVPVFALPEMVKIKDVEELRNIAFLTNFEDRDLLAFDTMMALLSFQDVNIFLAHFLSQRDEVDAWSEIKLSGIKSYFMDHYKASRVEYSVLSGSAPDVQLREYVAQNGVQTLALTSHRHGMIGKIINFGKARELVFHSDIPTFAFNS